MDSAKAAVKDFMAKSGHNDTTVHEKVAPAVQHETIERQKREEVVSAIDKEVHQDHYHTSVQPVQDREVLPEQHHHNIIPVEHRSFEHDNTEAVKQKLAAEQAQFRNTTEHVEAETQRSVAPVVAGEHIHHHVHETIQPVVEKQTIEPHVIHTTVPIHEVHHNAAQHHSASALPAVSMADFKKQGGVLTGREERYDGFEGEPRQVGGGLSSASATGTTGHSGHIGQTGGPTNIDGTDNRAGVTGTRAERDAGLAGSSGLTTSTSGTTNSSGKSHGGLLSKLNPKTDSDGDGKAGFLK